MADPISISELAALTKESSYTSEIELTRVITLRSRAAQATIARHYNDIEYAMRNIYRNTFRNFSNPDIQAEYDKKSSDQRLQVSNQIANLTELMQTAFDNYIECADENGFTIELEYSNAKEVALRMEVPEMAKIISLFDIADQTIVAAENVWLNQQISIEDKHELTTLFANKIKGLVRNSSIKANALLKMANEYKAQDQALRSRSRAS